LHARTMRWLTATGLLGCLAATVLGQTPVFEDLLTNGNKVSGRTARGSFSAAGFTLTQMTGTRATSLTGVPRSEDFVWYDLPGVGSDGTGTIEFDVVSLGYNEGPPDQDIFATCDSTGRNPATVKDDFWNAPIAGLMRKAGYNADYPTFANKMKLSAHTTPTNWKENFTAVQTWNATTVYRFRMCWNGAVVRMYRGIPGQTLSVIAPTPWTFAGGNYTPGILHIQLGSTFTALWANRDFGGDPGVTYSLLRVYEEDIGAAATPLRGSTEVPTDVSIDMGTTDVVQGLTNKQSGDGDTIPVTIGGRNCRQNVDPAQDHYFYFDIDDAFAYQGSRPIVDITFDYYDTGAGTMKLQYDSSDGSYTPNPKYKTAETFDLTGENTWKQHTFHITDAYFGNQENAQTDFRICGPITGTFYVDTVRVSGPPARAIQPSPANQSNYVSINADLSWAASSGANSYDVYFGTASPGDFRGNQVSTSFDPGTLQYSTTYYWRIDSKGTTGTTLGDVWSFTTQSSTQTNTVLGVSSDGRFFTINGVPTFLHGVSYYGSQYITTADYRTQDLDDMAADGFNWLRTWGLWAWPWWTAENVSVLEKDGSVREPYMSRMKTLIAECNARGIVVDVTILRDTANDWHGPSTQSLHLNAVRTLATELLPYRNVYFDVGNERDSSGCFVSFAEMGQLIDAVHAIDPGRLCTASGEVNTTDNTLADYINTGHVDFLGIHLCRQSTCPASFAATIQGFVNDMATQGLRRVPLHWQEPFRRNISNNAWLPAAEDFYRGETGVKLAEGAGWCFHNGGRYDDTRPWKSYNMSDPEGRLYDQLDSVEITVANDSLGQIGSTDINVRRYQTEYDSEQLTHTVGRKEGPAWSANVTQDAAGLMTSGPLLDTVPPGQHVVKWRLMIDNNTSDNDAVLTLIVRGGGAQLASQTVTRQQFTAASTYQIFTVGFTSTGQKDIEFRTDWLDKAYIKCDWIELTIGGGDTHAPLIAEVSPDPDAARPGVPYVLALSLLEGSPAPTWTVVQGPPGTAVSASGAVSGWTPALASVGTLFTFEVRASNSQGSDTESWQVLVRSAADFDGDGDVDQEDFGVLQSCFSAFGYPTPAGCEDVNLDGDFDVDRDDFNVFLPCVGGADQPPEC
jgi:hypothetical protein